MGGLDPDDPIDEGDHISIEGDIMDDDDDDETDFLGDVRFSIDDDDFDNEELLEARKNMNKFRGKVTKDLIIGEPSTTLVPSQPLDVDSVVDTQTSYEMEYYKTYANDSLGSM
ncbi:hypothetical protein NL676_025676 [Syzygium grande]|nr:hypothetical protein NL676_025676 [Syzygium grande]